MCVYPGAKMERAIIEAANAAAAAVDPGAARETAYRLACEANKVGISAALLDLQLMRTGAPSVERALLGMQAKQLIDIYDAGKAFTWACGSGYEAVIAALLPLRVETWIHRW